MHLVLTTIVRQCTTSNLPAMVLQSGKDDLVNSPKYFILYHQKSHTDILTCI